MTETIRRPADIFSPITDAVSATKVKYADARAAGRRGYDKPTPQNSIVLLVDHQMGLMLGMRDTQSLGQLVGNVVGLARTAKALGIPTLLTTSNAQWQNEDTLPELKEIFPDLPIYRRTGIINCYEDPTFRKAIEVISEGTGRRHIIIAAVTIGTCCLMPTLSMLNDGYSVYPVIDACGAWSKYEVDAASARMAAAGAELCSTFALACELQADWKLPSGQAMFEPFVKNLPEYGFAVNNFWNRVGGQAVPDPFKMVK
ncbi:isochorismatase family protein [Bradyrhizobium embrapense]